MVLIPLTPHFEQMRHLKEMKGNLLSLVSTRQLKAIKCAKIESCKGDGVNCLVCMIGDTLISHLIAFIKGCVHYIFARLFLGLNESTCKIKKNVYFTSKPLFIFEKIKF